MIKNTDEDLLYTFTLHNFTQKCVERAQGVGGQFCMSGVPTGRPEGSNGPPVYMLKYALHICIQMMKVFKKYSNDES